MNFKVKSKMFIAIFTAIVIIFVVFNLLEGKEKTRSLFSWYDSEVLEGRTNLFKTMKEMKLNTVYQEFSKKLKKEDVANFLKEGASEKIDIYMLVGSPEWALEKNGESMCQEVNRALEINKSVEENQGLKGIFFDVEPYLSEEWDKQTSTKIMNGFVESMKIVYKKAKDKGMEVILCIPYYYDDLGLSKQLEALIESCCDSIAIMNYYKGNEAENIKYEAALTAKYGKKLINIYELQPTGKSGINDKNTYHDDGTKAVEENFSKLRKAYRRNDISIAFHEYKALREVIGQK